MRSSLKVFLTALIVLSCFLSGCTKESSDDSSDNTESSDSSSPHSESASSPLVKCGVFTDGAFQQNVPFEKSEIVNVKGVGSDLVIITRTTGEQARNSQVVKLQGTTSSGISSSKSKRAADFTNANASFNALFLPASNDCTVSLPDGGLGVYGHIFTQDGRSLNEMLVQKGLANPEAGICGGDALAGCYAGLPVEEELSNQVINRFLWKPVSENDGKLVILHNAFGVNASVEGASSSMSGHNSGPSNGFSATVRYPLSGCAYGSATVRFFDSLDRIVPLANGETSLKISNGCDRTELRF